MRGSVCWNSALLNPGGGKMEILALGCLILIAVTLIVGGFIYMIWGD